MAKKYMGGTIARFADAAARDAAITKPVEGMFAYHLDDDSLMYHDGAKWVAVGGGGGATAKFAADVPATTARTRVDITHSLGTEDVLVTVREKAGNKEVVDCDIYIKDTNTITLQFVRAVTAAEFRVVVA
jgi:hypothetical protein